MKSFTTFDGLQLAYTDQGAGLPVLCLSGLTRSSTDFDYVAPYLDDVRMIRMDYRGRGQSPWAQDPLTYTIPVEAKDALALMNHLGLTRVAVLGTSRGGLIAMALGALAKDRLIGVCLNDIGPEIDNDGLSAIMVYLGRNPRFKSRAEMINAMPAGMIGFANVSMERWAEEVERHTNETQQGLTINYDPKLRDAIEAAGHQPAPDLWPLFDTLAGLPLALIRGANSNLLTLETTTQMQHHRPDLIYSNVPDRGHVPFLDEPESIAVIKTWLEACR